MATGTPAAAKQPPLDYQPPPADPPSAGAVDHPADGHLPGRIPDRLVGPGPYQRLPAIDESQWVVLAVRRQPYWTLGQLDPVLTEACRLGDFASLPLNRIIVRFAGDQGRAVAQVVPPLYRHLLVDRRRLARPGETYYFFATADPDCEVRVEGAARVRAFPVGRGTALPPTDPRALQKRKALIDSWTKP